jgi:hypothetical protein
VVVFLDLVVCCFVSCHGSFVVLLCHGLFVVVFLVMVCGLSVLEMLKI